jgi:methylated-DNA-protein-cysteine methyltransferase-like protein
MSTPDINPNAATDATIIAQVQRIVGAIPAGKVMSYGAVGAACEPPISGYICGRIMNGVIGEVPWWRVVGKDGNLPIRKRHPELSSQQRERLESEGVRFDTDGKVLIAHFDSPNAPNLFTS